MTAFPEQVRMSGLEQTEQSNEAVALHGPGRDSSRRTASGMTVRGTEAPLKEQPQTSCPVRNGAPAAPRELPPRPGSVSRVIAARIGADHAIVLLNETLLKLRCSLRGDVSRLILDSSDVDPFF